MFQPEVNLTDPFIRSLACAAVNPGLRSILVLDAPYSSFEKEGSTFLYFSGKGSEQEGVRRENTILMIA
jgi:hypothetical protein